MEETRKAKSALNTLNILLDDLGDKLEPLFQQSLSESLVDLSPIQQAKLQTVLPYVIYDLIFIYLKSTGNDPRSHPVISELERVKQYFEKIKNAETPDTSRMTVDKEAATRFIKHAISQVQQQKDSAQDQQPGPSTAPQPLKVTSKMLEREQYLKELKERDVEEGSEDGDLQVYGDEHEASSLSRFSKDDTNPSAETAPPAKRRKGQKSSPQKKRKKRKESE